MALQAGDELLNGEYRIHRLMLAPGFWLLAHHGVFPSTCHPSRENTGRVKEASSLRLRPSTSGRA